MCFLEEMFVSYINASVMQPFSAFVHIGKCVFALVFHLMHRTLSPAGEGCRWIGFVQSHKDFTGKL